MIRTIRSDTIGYIQDKVDLKNNITRKTSQENLAGTVQCAFKVKSCYLMKCIEIRHQNSPCIYNFCLANTSLNSYSLSLYYIPLKTNI